MKILVVDDSNVNLAAAQATLVGHELTICGSYDDALKLLGITFNEDLVRQKLVAAGFPEDSSGLNMPPHGKRTAEDDARWTAWWEAERKFTEESQNPYWDAVLVDLLMPAGKDAQGPNGKPFVGQLMPVGFALALLAAKNGAKYIAVVTVENHHNHPASAMLDRLENSGWYSWRGENRGCEINAGAGFSINGAKVGFFHGVRHHVEGMTCPSCIGKKYQVGKPCSSCHGSGNNSEYVDGKGWQTIVGKPCTYCDGSKFEPCHDCNKTGLATGKDWAKVLESLQKE